MLTRRGAVICLFSGSLLAASGEFWNDKAPAKWTAEEIKALLNQSPWAKPAAMRFDKTAPGFDIFIYGPVTPSVDAPGGNGPGGKPVGFQVVIRWESALPVRRADKMIDSESAEMFYVVSATGDFPGKGSLTEDPAAWEQRQAMLRQFTKLERKGEPLYLDHVQPRDDGMLFYFSRQDPIILANKEITFSTRMGPLEMKAKFPLKDMAYRGKLEL